MIYPDNFEQKIGMAEIRTMLRGRCLSSLGTEEVENMRFLTNCDDINRAFRQTYEMRRILQEADDFPQDNYIDVRQALVRIRPDGTYLEEGELFDLKRSLHAIMLIVGFLSATADDGSPRYPALSALAEGAATFPDVVARIDAILNKYGRMNDDASPELLRIRHDIAAAERSLSRALADIIGRAQRDGYVDRDINPTLRDGRLVIPVSPSLKRKIPGIVHDESASGKTVFIEPTAVVEGNNRIRSLQADERREVISILRAVSAEVRPHIQQMLPSLRFLGKIDFVRAKAQLAEVMHAIEPTVEPQPVVDWAQAVHPLLQQSLQRHGKAMVPLDIVLTPRDRILIISGPNAGGKSVTLKTVGLLQYMAQCGLSIPLAASSHVGLFGSIFIDIGDQQSIENDLSTYSSHLLNMKTMMQQADGRSLLLIDEMGSGTEPQIGGALAEAILKQFVAKKAFAVITTHYQNLKQFADAHQGVVNGAMLYDRQQFRPLFALQIGQPGSSFAVEVARQIGLPAQVIDDAVAQVGNGYVQSEKYLLDIARDKRYWENKRQNIHQKEKQLDMLMANYESEMSQLQQSRRSVIDEARSKALDMLKAANARIENTIRAIREAQAEREQTKLARAELKSFQLELQSSQAADGSAQIERKMAQLKARQERHRRRVASRQEAQKGSAQSPSAVAAAAPAADTKPQPGDYVRLAGQQAVGQLKEVDGSRAVVLYGSMQAIVGYSDLRKCQKPRRPVEQAVSYVSRQTQDALHQRKLAFKPLLDVRGLRGDEALRQVTQFIDDAQLLGVSPVRILHGTGQGILRELVRQYLSSVPGVASYADERVQLGGAGITVVRLQ